MKEDLSLENLQYYDIALKRVASAYHTVYNDVEWMFSDNEREMLCFNKPVAFHVDAEFDGTDVRLVRHAYFCVRIAGEVFVWIDDFHPKGVPSRGAYFRAFRFFGVSEMYRMRMALMEDLQRRVVDKKKFAEMRYSVFGYSKKSPFHSYIDAFYSVTEERKRHEDNNGLTLKAALNADEDYELAKAAFCLIFDDIEKYSDGVPRLWPYSEDRWKELTEGRSSGDRIASAAALLVAEMEKDAGEHECIRCVIERIDRIGREKHDNGDILSRVRGLLTRYFDLNDGSGDDDNDDEMVGNIYALPDVVLDMIHVLGNIRQEDACEKRR